MIRLTASPYAIDIESSFDGLSSPYLNIYPQLIHRIGPCLPLSSYSLQRANFYSFYGFTLGKFFPSHVLVGTNLIRVLPFLCIGNSFFWAIVPITEQLTVIAGLLLLIRHERKDRKLHSSRGNLYRRSFDCRKNSQRSRQRSERREHDR